MTNEEETDEVAADEKSREVDSTDDVVRIKNSASVDGRGVIRPCPHQSYAGANAASPHSSSKQNALDVFCA